MEPRAKMMVMIIMIIGQESKRGVVWGNVVGKEGE
jgi:hypothetical protein